jgi:hypothetical protein
MQALLELSLSESTGSTADLLGDRRPLARLELLPPGVWIYHELRRRDWQRPLKVLVLDLRPGEERRVRNDAFHRDNLPGLDILSRERVRSNRNTAGNQHRQA